LIGSDVGPYRVISELGSGGMGTVYLAEVAERTPVLDAGQRVALKIVHPHLIATPGFFKRFLREAELGKQVRHENVVRTLDVDATLVDDTQINYMVLEYVEGRSLRDLLRDLGTVPEALLREISLQMAAGVEAIHSEGVVHRDLKPENVLITDDHRIRIMDLGVAKLQEASVALTREGQFAGSLLYAAPEQFNQDEVGTAADLYSIGVVLYELATGVNPFKYDEPARVINAHLNSKPPPASDRNPELSPLFCEVISTLLEKEVAQRFASAAELKQVLEEGARSEWWAKREKSIRTEQTSIPQLRVPRETAVHGRDAELAILREAWSHAKQGHGNTVLLEGEAGIGKTRLIDAFLRSLDDEDGEPHVLYGSYPPSGGLGALSDAILRKFGESGLDRSLAPYLTVTPSLVPAFAALIKHESPPTGAAPLHGEALQAVCSHLMRALSEERPTIWVIEDVHFAPGDSRDLLHALARAAALLRMLLIITARPGMAESELSHFTRLTSLQRYTLGRLGAREVIELLRDAFKSESIATKLGGTIAYKSDGVPFFVFEMIRGLKAGSLLKQQSDGSYVQTQVISEIEVPSAVKDLIEARLQGLSKEERAILDLGAVIGFEFDPDLVARVRGVKRIQVLETLADLERRSGIVRGGAGVCRFDQYQIHELLLDKLMPDLRAEYHSLLADAYAEREGIEGPDDDLSGEEALFLASQYLKGSNPRAAIPYVPAALTSLEVGHRNDAAIRMCDDALAIRRGLKGVPRLEVLLRKASRHDLLGQRDEERVAHDEALAIADESDDLALRARTRSALAWFHANVAEFKESQERFHEALALTRESGDRGVEARILADLAGVHWYNGTFEQGCRDATEAIAIWRELEDRRGVALGSGRIGINLWYLGRLGEALEAVDECIAISREVKDPNLEAVAHVNRGPICAGLGRLDEAREELEEAQRMLQSVGAQRPYSYAQHRLADLAVQRGDLAGAERLYTESLALRRQIRLTLGVAETLVALGRLYRQTGDPQRAAQCLEEGLGIARGIDAAEAIVLAAAHTARLAANGTEEVEKLLQTFETRISLRARIETRFLLWQATQDRAQLESARALLDDHVANAPEEDRARMIENVPLHREIMQAVQEQGA